MESYHTKGRPQYYTYYEKKDKNQSNDNDRCENIYSALTLMLYKVPSASIDAI